MVKKKNKEEPRRSNIGVIAKPHVDGEATKVEIWLSLLDSTSGFKYNYKREHQNDDWESRNAFTWCFDTQKTGDCTNRNYDFNRNTLTIDAKHEQICDRGS